MPQKSILITGCSTGIGYDAAHRLHKLGWQVFATCRKEADCARLRSEGLISFQLDYDDPQSIGAALDLVLEQTGGTLDALYNNGAYAIPGAVEDVSRDALRAIFESNLFGWQDLTIRIIPLMRAQGYGKIINCSSVLGMVPMKWRGAYVATKFALEGLTDCMRLELQGSGISVVLIEPGPIGSAFRSNAKLQFERWIDWQNAWLKDLYENTLLQRLHAAGNNKDTFELPPSAVTEKLVKALMAKRPRARYFVTKPTYFADFIRRALPTRLSDMILSRG